MTHGDTVAVIANSVLFSEVELVHLNIKPGTNRRSMERFEVPLQHPQHVIHHRGETEFRRPTGWPVYPQGHEPATDTGERNHVRQIGKVIDMEMRNEDVIDLSRRHTHGKDVLDRLQ